jgi:hypothetical protein
MKRQDDEHSACGGCGATIYREHLDSGIARYEDGKLLCPHCVAEAERRHEDADRAAGGGFEPIEFDDKDDDEVQVEMTSSRIHAASAATLGLGGGWDDTKYERAIDSRAISATRCRTFHAKLSEAALEFMNNQINEWLDKNEGITVKFANSTIGIFEGKHAEPNLILTLFY